jgi:exosome complex component RRP41
MQTLLDPIIGLRIDGRKPNELRKIQCEVGVFAQADGSASLSQGNTKIVATVYGPHEVNKRNFQCEFIFISINIY